MRQRVGLLLGVLGLLMPTACSSVTTPAPDPIANPSVVARRPVGRRIEPFLYPVIVEGGTASQIGEAHGEKLGADVRYLHNAYLSQFLKSRTQSAVAGALASLFRPYILPEHLAEIDALAATTKIDARDMLLGQCFLDLTPMAACSTVALPASASADGVPRMGRNLDFWSMGVAERYTKVFIIKPTDGRYGFASVGWPGTIGVLSGMNQFGLTLANMEVPRALRFPQAMPYSLLYRHLLERCRTVPEAIALLRSTTIQTANNLMLMDADGNRVVVELQPPGTIIVRRGLPQLALLSTNHQRGQDQDSPGRCWRYDRMHSSSASQFGSFDTSSVEQMLASVGGDTTLQSIIFEPTRCRIILAAGKAACGQPYSTLDLTPYFATDDSGLAFSSSQSCIR